MVAFIIIGTFYLYEIVPRNSEAECRNQCASSKNPGACAVFCDCIYKQGQPLDSCLATFDKAKDIRRSAGKWQLNKIASPALFPGVLPKPDSPMSGFVTNILTCIR